MEFTLERFHSAQETAYEVALREIRSGRKQSHWIWFIFPQYRGLGRSPVAQYYEIQSREEAVAYWNDPVLSRRLAEISAALLNLEGSIEQIMGFPDNLKLRSCMTLFWLVSGEQVFQAVLDRFFDGKTDEYTVEQLRP
ncbi:MAG: DUF1810 domain-containing protein [Oscillospiraceae bacterium]|nr:DUF1810 domain-containing protein [Oscillospiraceae bacterium]